MPQPACVDNHDQGEEFDMDDFDEAALPLIAAKPDNYGRRRTFAQRTQVLQRYCVWPRQLQILNPRRYAAFWRTSRIWLQVIVAVILTSILSGIFLTLVSPSYANPPAHYDVLRKRAHESTESGRANLGHEKVFIAAILHDPGGELISGAWGRNVLELIDLVGVNNSFLSIYESDSGPEAGIALDKFRHEVDCQNELISEPTLPLDKLQTYVLPNGDDAVKRIAYLAAARNRALEPLKVLEPYDRVLYLNDVIFDPVEAAQLLFATNINADSRAEYGAACAMDFRYPFLYYDTFATRDAEGYSIGVPVYPFFSAAGDRQSRTDMVERTDHVRVKSCWGGMVAFDARLFQPTSMAQTSTDAEQQQSPSTVQFRSETELGWEYSECCLIHADIQNLNTTSAGAEKPLSTAIYMNPYIRTAYDKWTFYLLDATARLERFLFPFHVLIDDYVGLPWFNERRTYEKQPIWKNVWSGNNRSRALLEGDNWEHRLLPADPGSFCGVKSMLIRRLAHETGNGTDKASWETLPAWSLPHVEI
jgi:hypothetical protein